MSLLAVHPTAITLQGNVDEVVHLHLRNLHPIAFVWKIFQRSLGGPIRVNPIQGVLDGSATCVVTVKLASVKAGNADGQGGPIDTLDVTARPLTSHEQLNKGMHRTEVEAVQGRDQQLILCAQVPCWISRGPKFVDPSPNATDGANLPAELHVVRPNSLDPKLLPATPSSAASPLAGGSPSPKVPSFDGVVSTGCNLFLLGSVESSPKKTLGSYQAAFKAHSDSITCLAYSPDGRQLATCSADTEIHLWSTETAHRIRSLKGHRQPVSAVSYFDSEQLVSSGRDGVAIVWDLASGSIVHRVECAPEDVTAAACPDGVRFATIDAYHTVRIWDRWSGAELEQLEDRTASHGLPLLSPPKLCFDPTGTLLATTGSNGVVKIWDMTSPSGAELRSSASAHLYEVTGVCFHRSGKQLATCGKDGAIHLWTVPELTRLFTYLGHSEIVYSISFTADGTHLISAGSVESRPNVRLWDTQNRTCVQSLVGPTTLVTTLAANPAGTEVAAATLNGGVYAWSTSAFTVLGVLEGHRARVKHYSINSTKTQLVSLDTANTVKVWDTHSFQCLATSDAKRWIEMSSPIHGSPLDQSHAIDIDQVCFAEGIQVSYQGGKLHSKTLTVPQLQRLDGSPKKPVDAAGESDDLSALCSQLDRRLGRGRAAGEKEDAPDSRLNPTVWEAFRLANAYLDSMASAALIQRARSRLTELEEELRQMSVETPMKSDSLSPLLSELSRAVRAFEVVDENLQGLLPPTEKSPTSSEAAAEREAILQERDSTRKEWVSCFKALKASLIVVREALGTNALLPRFDSSSIAKLRSECKVALIQGSVARLKELLAAVGPVSEQSNGNHKQRNGMETELAELLERCAPDFIGAMTDGEVHQRCKDRDAERAEAETLAAAAQSLSDAAQDQYELLERVEKLFPSDGSETDATQQPSPHAQARSALDHFIRAEMLELHELKENLSNLTRKVQRQAKFGLAVDPKLLQQRDALDVQVIQKSVEFGKHYQALIPLLRAGFPELIPDLRHWVDPHCGHHSMRWDISLADFETEHDPVSLGRCVSVRYIRPKSKESKNLRPELDRYVLKSFHSVEENHEFLREVEVMDRAVHRNIAALEFTFIDQDTKYLALPFYPSTAMAWFQLHSGEVDSILRALLEMVEGVAHLHSVGVIHADIKPDNLMFSDAGSQGSPKWLDFNFSVVSHERTEVMLRAATAPVGGTAGFMAPELLANPGAPPTPEIDVFGLGATMKALLSIGIGSGSESPKHKGGADTFRKGLGEELFLVFAKLLDSMTAPSPEQRPSLEKPHYHRSAEGSSTRNESCWEVIESLRIRWSRKATGTQ
jgi:WD40 repeat protein/serine/threonine protein kinase